VRLDKYLKVSRLIKRRTVAKEFAENERVTVNGRVAKPSTNVNVGDILTIQMGGRQITIKILELKDNVKAGDAQSLYRIVNEEPPRV